MFENIRIWISRHLHSILSNSDSFSESFAFKSRISLWREKETNSSHRGIVPLLPLLPLLLLPSDHFEWNFLFIFSVCPILLSLFLEIGTITVFSRKFVISHSAKIWPSVLSWKKIKLLGKWIIWITMVHGKWFCVIYKVGKANKWLILPRLFSSQKYDNSSPLLRIWEPAGKMI